MDDAEFDDALDDYLSGRVAPNPEMFDVEISWIRGNPELGSNHIALNGVTEEEVEEVLLEVPPYVEARRHRDYPDRTIFWGATRAGRWLFISTMDTIESGRRVLTPITAFEPQDGDEYWRRQ